MYICIADWDEANKVIAETRAPDEATAVAVVAIMKSEGYDNAFWALTPNNASSNLIVDPAAKTVSFDSVSFNAEQAAVAWGHLRSERNTKLTESDWTQSPDSPLTSEAKTSWATYRETLRNLPANTDDPADPPWPDAPVS